MASQSVARSESIAAFIPDLELLITEAMDEWKVPGLAVAVGIASLVAPFELLAKDVVFTRIAADDCTNPAFRQRCTAPSAREPRLLLPGWSSISARTGKVDELFFHQPNGTLLARRA
jgi:hypothetical protein